MGFPTFRRNWVFFVISWVFVKFREDVPDPGLYINSGFHSLSNFACGASLLEECEPLMFPHLQDAGLRFLSLIFFSCLLVLK